MILRSSPTGLQNAKIVLYLMIFLSITLQKQRHFCVTIFLLQHYFLIRSDILIKINIPYFFCYL